MSVAFEILSADNADRYIKYLEKAFAEEPERMLVDRVDGDAVKKRLSDPFYSGKKSLLAMENGEVIGRIEYHFYGCLQDGYKMAYVDWVYVLKGHRHKGVAQGLFREFEKDCRDNDIDQYYLVRSTNEEATRFYNSFNGAELDEMPMLRKNIKG